MCIYISSHSCACVCVCGSLSLSLSHTHTLNRFFNVRTLTGLKWSPDEKMLASGGNDNKLYVWSTRQGASANPMCRFMDHNAAVKAVAWSPHTSGLLASGGGTADRNIRFWNSHTGVPLHRIDTGSQVCVYIISCVSM